jgi:hypothetical protein
MTFVWPKDSERQSKGSSAQECCWKENRYIEQSETKRNEKERKMKARQKGKSKEETGTCLKEMKRARFLTNLSKLSNG